MTLADRIWLRSKRSIDRCRTAPIDFDLQLHLHGRHSGFLLWALAAHHTVRVRDHEAILLRRMLPLGRWLRHTLLERTTPDARPARLTVVDDPAKLPGPGRRACLDDDWFRSIDPDRDARAPYFMHPRAYRHELLGTFPALRRQPSRFLTGFAGSVFADYGSMDSFSLLSRPGVLATTRAAFGARALTLQAAGLSVAPDILRRAFVESVTAVVVDNLEKHTLSQDRYFEFVAECDFFLCPPGWMMPPSHNLVEAMSVGTIPVLAYPNYFDPPLRDGVNCVAYSTTDDLHRLPARLDALTPTQVAAMTTAVLDYHDRHLDGAAFARSLLNRPDGPLNILYNSEGGSVAKLDARTKAAAPANGGRHATFATIHS